MLNKVQTSEFENLFKNSLRNNSFKLDSSPIRNNLRKTHNEFPKSKDKFKFNSDIDSRSVESDNSYRSRTIANKNQQKIAESNFQQFTSKISNHNMIQKKFLNYSITHKPENNGIKNLVESKNSKNKKQEINRNIYENNNIDYHQMYNIKKSSTVDVFDMITKMKNFGNEIPNDLENFFEDDDIRKRSNMNNTINLSKNDQNNEDYFRKSHTNKDFFNENNKNRNNSPYRNKNINNSINEKDEKSNGINESNNKNNVPEKKLYGAIKSNILSDFFDK